MVLSLLEEHRGDIHPVALVSIIHRDVLHSRPKVYRALDVMRLDPFRLEGDFPAAIAERKAPADWDASSAKTVIPVLVRVHACSELPTE